MDFIQAKNLEKNYGQGETGVTAIKNISFSLEKGEFAAIMGESGSGKSTLLTIMGALNRPTNGKYSVDSIDIYDLTQDERAEFRQEYLGFMFQSFHLVPYLTVGENIMLPLVTRKMKPVDKRELVITALEQVGLSGKYHRLPGEISGGEQERAALARAIVNDPAILLADEPTGNLDSRTTHEIMKLIKSLGDKGMTVAMVTHSPECARYAGRVMMISDGCLLS